MHSIIDLTMDNYKFLSLLAATPLSAEEKHNLGVIFSALTPSRQLDIIDNWWRYLDKILIIQNMAESERKFQIEETFGRINKLIDEAYIRDQEKKAFQKIEKQEKDAQMLASMEYDQRRRLDAMKNMDKSQEIAREKLSDPLSFI